MYLHVPISTHRFWYVFFIIQFRMFSNYHCSYFLYPMDFHVHCFISNKWKNFFFFILAKSKYKIYHLNHFYLICMCVVCYWCLAHIHCSLRKYLNDFNHLVFIDACFINKPIVNFGNISCRLEKDAYSVLGYSVVCPLCRILNCVQIFCTRSDFFLFLKNQLFKDVLKFWTITVECI